MEPIVIPTKRAITDYSQRFISHLHTIDVDEDLWGQARAMGQHETVLDEYIATFNAWLKAGAIGEYTIKWPKADRLSAVIAADFIDVVCDSELRPNLRGIGPRRRSTCCKRERGSHRTTRNQTPLRSSRTRSPQR